MATEVDVVIIGMGPGGEDAGGKLARAGLQVVGIERSLVGGECPYWGCIPSKMMIRAANLLAEARRIPGIAGRAAVEPDWAPVARRIREEATDHWDDRVAVDRFTGKGGHFIRGTGRITAPGAVTVTADDGTETEYRARRAIVIATGTTPAVPPIPGLADVPYWTNHEAVAVETLPRSLIVLGGGAIGMELSQVFARFGVEVTLVEGASRLLPLEEPEAGETLRSVFETEGIGVHTGTRAERVEQDGDQAVVHLDTGESLRAERLLLAVGRHIDLGPLGVEHVGLDPEARSIAVDERLRAAPGVWAVGDVTGEGAFTHVALYQSAIAVSDILGEGDETAAYGALGRVTFTDPEVASVGVSEEEARERGLRIGTGSQLVARSARGWLHAAGNEGFIKLICDLDREVLVGATSVGPHGGEVLSMLSLAVHAQVPLGELETMIYAYPTFHGGVRDALRDLRRQQADD